MATASKTFRIFVSSTFSDLKAERNALQERVFPKLKELCLQNGCRFQAIDLRWGVRDEAALDQKTMHICLDEINRCQRTTPRPNFIILLGDRYGWQPLPAEIPADEFLEIEKAVSADEEKELLKTWYFRDDNAVPPIFALKARRIDFSKGKTEEDRQAAREKESREWGEIETELQRILRMAVSNAQVTEEQIFKYVTSATEQEIAAGALSVPDSREHVFCFFRKIDGLPQDLSAKDFIDLNIHGNTNLAAKDKLSNLKQGLQDQLPENVFDYRAKWTGKDISTDHLDRFADDVYEALSRVILKEVDRLEEIDPLDKEVIDHDTFGKDRSKHFIGRANILLDIENYTQQKAGHPLAIFGVSGSGKSALMAQAVEKARQSHPKANVFARYIGATPDISDVRFLLDSLCQQITREYGGEEASIPSDYKELVEEFPKRLAYANSEKPLIIFLDALDQLSEAHNAKNLVWLPSIIPEHVHLIASVLPGEGLEALKRKLPQEKIIELNPLSVEEGDQILKAWLKNSFRTLQPPQYDFMIQRFRQNGLPLYLKLGFEEAKRWTSSLSDFSLSSDIPGIIQDMFARLSEDVNHGKILVSRSLGYIAAAKNGLSEDELLDVLSLDQEVFTDFKKRTYHEPPEQKLPVVIWSRLYFDLEPYLTERSADGALLLSFYHRQLAEAVNTTLLSGPEKTSRHTSLADYFESQPLLIEKEKTKQPNLRKLSEQPYQQSLGKLWDALYETLTDFEFLEAKCTYSSANTIIGEGEDTKTIYGGVYDLLEDYRFALELFPKTDNSQ